MNINPSLKITSTIVFVFGSLLIISQLYDIDITISSYATTNMSYSAGVYAPNGSTTTNIQDTDH